MQLDLVPIAEFSARLAEGWRMVPGYPLEPGDWAVTMIAPRPKRSSNVAAGNGERIGKMGARMPTSKKHAFLMRKLGLA